MAQKGLGSAPLLSTSSRRAAPGSRQCTLVARASSSSKTQRYQSGALDVEMPLGYVQQLDVPLQAGVFFGSFAVLAAATWANCAFVAPGLERAAPELFAASRATWPVLAAGFVPAGVAHFALHDSFCTMMPRPGAWGVWYLPGSASFHVNWTGVAEALGGFGVLAGSLAPVAQALPGLHEASALGLFWLTVAVSPANLYMATHNAPGPGPAGTVIPPAGHAVRFLMQVLLLSTWWGLAHPPA
jgi:uncharacterized membrane protein